MDKNRLAVLDMLRRRPPTRTSTFCAKEPECRAGRPWRAESSDLTDAANFQRAAGRRPANRSG
jgi:hypothetical protein